MLTCDLRQRPCDMGCTHCHTLVQMLGVTTVPVIDDAHCACRGMAVYCHSAHSCLRRPIFIMQPAELQQLEQLIDQLLLQHQRLKTENATLRSKQAELLAERNRLAEKNELATHKVEAMLTRLRGLEKAE